MNLFCRILNIVEGVVLLISSFAVKDFFQTVVLCGLAVLLFSTSTIKEA